MAKKGSPHDQFLEELKHLWWRCGSPELAKIVKTSHELRDLYADSERIVELPTLSKSAISAVLNGDRDEVPRGEWIAAYVITVMYLGWRVGAIPERPNEAVLMEWQYRRYLACAGPDASPGEVPAAGAGTPELPLPAPIMEYPVDTEIPRLDADERAHVAESGAAGGLLLDRYASGDVNACYQMAVLLAAMHGRTATSRGLLLYAAAADHPAAAELLNDCALADPEALAVHAEMIASTATEPPITTAFLECAHACRNRPATPGPPTAG